jgi:hypothetical protein
MKRDIRLSKQKVLARPFSQITDTLSTTGRYGFVKLLQREVFRAARRGPCSGLSVIWAPIVLPRSLVERVQFSQTQNIRESKPERKSGAFVKLGPACTATGLRGDLRPVLHQADRVDVDDEIAAGDLDGDGTGGSELSKS